jgi:hypothetical protein
MLRTLNDVPRSEYSDLHTPKNLTDKKERLSFLRMLRQKPSKTDNNSRNTKHKTLSFNAAVWLNFLTPTKNAVSLWLSYKDSKGENTILVDEQCLDQSNSAMLSGNVSIKVVGDIEYLRACCGGMGVNETYSVDEFYVRRLENDLVYMKGIRQSA